MADARIEHRHQVQRLHDVGAVLARQREIGLEAVVAVEMLHLLDDVLRELRRMTADLQQRQHQRRELMAQRNAGKAQVDVLPRRAERERRRALGSIGYFVDVDLVRQQCQILQQAAHLLRRLAVVEIGLDLDRTRDPFEIGLQLFLEIGVQHDVLRDATAACCSGMSMVKTIPSCPPGRASSFPAGRGAARRGGTGFPPKRE
jgi:hypothetical protein